MFYTIKLIFIHTLVLTTWFSVRADRGNYVGCYKKDLQNFKTNIIVGNVDVCLDVCEDLYYRYAVVNDESCSCTNSPQNEQLDLQVCNTRCKNNRSQFCGGVDVESYYDVNIRVPGPPRNLRLVGNMTNSSISIGWEAPELVSLVSQYSVKAAVIHTYSTSQLMTPMWVIQKSDLQTELVNLHPGTRYNITVTSVSFEGEGGNISIVTDTLIGIPDVVPDEPKILDKNDTTMAIEIEPVINNNGPTTFYRVVVIYVGQGVVQPFDEELLKSYSESQEDGISYYITAELDLHNTTKRFLIGDGRTYRGFYNAPLPANTHIHVAIGIVSTENNVTTYRYGNTTHEQHSHIIDYVEEADNGTLVVVLSVACVFFALLLIGSIFVYFYLRKKIGSPRRRLGDHHELTLQGPIVEIENNGFVSDELDKGNFKDELKYLFNRIPDYQKLPRNALSLDIDNILGNGNFGDIIRGNLHSNSDVYQCHVHVISDDMERQDQLLFVKEFDQMLNVTPNAMLINFLGICQTPDWIYVVVEDPGSTLKRRLLDARISVNIGNARMSSLSEEYIITILCDLAGVMEYLAARRIVHRRLSSYNAYVNFDDEVKLSLFGPTLFMEANKTVDLSRYHAPEVLKFQHHTSCSDVWSFACLAWECCTLGGTLYSNIPSADLLPRIKNGARPEQTPFIFNDLYQLLLNCWELDPNERPTFTEINGILRQLLTAPRHVLSFDRREGYTLPYYLPLLEIKN